MPLLDTFPAHDTEVTVDYTSGVISFSQHVIEYDPGDSFVSFDIWVEGWIDAAAAETVLGTADPNARPAWLTGTFSSGSRSSDGVLRAAQGVAVDLDAVPYSDWEKIVFGLSIVDTRGITTDSYFWLSRTPPTP